jgi:hypothetical protein
VTSPPQRRRWTRGQQRSWTIGSDRRFARRKREQREWNAAHRGSIADPGVFSREILPAIQTLPLSDLVRATGLTHGYLSKIRRGEKVPHPRDWPPLKNAGEVT